MLVITPAMIVLLSVQLGLSMASLVWSCNHALSVNNDRSQLQSEHCLLSGSTCFLLRGMLLSIQVHLQSIIRHQYEST